MNDMFELYELKNYQNKSGQKINDYFEQSPNPRQIIIHIDHLKAQKIPIAAVTRLLKKKNGAALLIKC